MTFRVCHCTLPYMTYTGVVNNDPCEYCPNNVKLSDYSYVPQEPWVNTMDGPWANVLGSEEYYELDGELWHMVDCVLNETGSKT